MNIKIFLASSNWLQKYRVLIYFKESIEVKDKNLIEFEKECKKIKSVFK
ncbi:MAG: hypothetical protein GXO02_00285 [Epsilonproteobacteria bacterium]|nr:hypothetical protein [Campylobacterota bacterium]